MGYYSEQAVLNGVNKMGTCLNCKKEFGRTSENDHNWSIKKFCCRKCKQGYNARTNYNYKKRGYNLNSAFPKGRNHPMWKGGTTTDKNGYRIMMIEPKTYIKEHRWIMEKHLGRSLDKKEVVHHKNGIRTDNKIDNLYCFKSKKEHTKYHRGLQKLVNLILYDSDKNILLREIRKYKNFIRLSKLKNLIDKCYTILYFNIKELIKEGFIIINESNNNKFALEILISKKGIKHLNYLEGFK